MRTPNCARVGAPERIAGRVRTRLTWFAIKAGSQQFVSAALASFERGNVVEGRLTDRPEGLTREEGLMRGDHNVGERQQSAEYVVPDDMWGQILEEQLFFFFVDVNAQVADLPALEPLDECRRVDERAATRVDDHDAGLHTSDRLCIDQVSRLGGQRRVQRDYVGSRPDLFEWDVLDASGTALRVGCNVVRQHETVERLEDPRNDCSDLAGANDPRGTPHEVETQ